MRRFLPVPFALLAIMAACSSEPSFDERYDETRERIEEKAEALDRELEDGPDAPDPRGGDQKV
ncbi:MAG: hypothetical protein V2J14_04535 [Erythrobacter sp.]|jgi:hypothetical protein|nr:hypothetical protein [Erythrobacter sp.]